MPDWSAGHTITGRAGESVSKGPVKGGTASRGSAAARGDRPDQVPALAALITINPEGLSTVMDGGWEEVELAVDSGASETVISEDMVMSVDLCDSPASKRGVEYEVANGVRIPNLGEKRFVGTSEEGISRRLTAQVCEVNKGLLSVSKVTKAGSRVIFDSDGSYIEDKTSGERMYLAERNGMFMLKLWTKRPDF